MSQNRIEQTDELIDQAERLVIMGVKKTWQLMRLLPELQHNFPRAKKILETAQRRLRRRKYHIQDIELHIRKQLEMYDEILDEMWSAYRVASQHPVNHKAMTDCMKVIIQVLKQKAELLGLEAPKVIDLKQSNVPDTTLYEKVKQLPENEQKQIIAILDKLDQAGT